MDYHIREPHTGEYFSGWFESERGAELFEVTERSVQAAGERLAKMVGAAAVGVEREVEGRSRNHERRFWLAYDRAAG